MRKDGRRELAQDTGDESRSNSWQTGGILVCYLEGCLQMSRLWCYQGRANLSCSAMVAFPVVAKSKFGCWEISEIYARCGDENRTGSAGRLNSEWCAGQDHQREDITFKFQRCQSRDSIEYGLSQVRADWAGGCVCDSDLGSLSWFSSQSESGGIVGRSWQTRYSTYEASACSASACYSNYCLLCPLSNMAPVGAKRPLSFEILTCALSSLFWWRSQHLSARPVTSQSLQYELGETQQWDWAQTNAGQQFRTELSNRQLLS